MVKPSLKWIETLREKKIPGEEAIGAARKELEQAGKKYISIVPDDPNIAGFVNQELSEGLIQAARDGLHMYPSHTNLRNELKKAIADFERRVRNVDYLPEDVIITPGVGGAFNVLHNSLLNPGDEILAFDPCHYLAWPTTYLSLFQAKVVGCRTLEGKGWEPDLEELRRSITDRTKTIVIVNPNNPTGAVLNEKILKNIIEIAGEHDLPIVSDEIYCLITYDGIEAKSTAALAGDVPVIVLSGMAKCFMRAGWRVGYMCFHDPKEKLKELFDVAQGVSSTYGHTLTGMPTPILAAATKAYQAYQCSIEATKRMVKQLQTQMDFTYKRLNEIKGMSCTRPGGSIWCFPHVHDMRKTWGSEVDFVLRLLREENILVNPGHYFGVVGHDHFRTGLLPKLETMEVAYDRLEKFMRAVRA